MTKMMITELKARTMKVKDTHKIQSLKVNRACLKNHTISKTYQVIRVFTVEFMTQDVLLNASVRTATSGFVMERVKMTTEVIFSGTWLRLTIKRSRCIQNLL